MKSVRLFLVLSIAVVGLAYLVFSPSKRGDREIDNRVNDLVVGEPIVFQNLAVFPVSSKTPHNEDRFTTLDEGLSAGTVEIVELGAATGGESAGSDPFAGSAPTAVLQTAEPAALGPQTNTHANSPPSPIEDPFAEGGQRSRPGDGAGLLNAAAVPVQGNSVNQLMVVNRSDKPLYLMPGEIVVGGSQDRAVGQELVVAPDKKPVPLNVFCVEHGRWGGRAAEAYATILPTAGEGVPVAGFAANLSLSVAQTAEVANAGKFIGSIGSLNAHGRMAVQKDKDQVRVWDEVAKQNAKNSVESITGTFTANYSSTESADRLVPFIERLLKPIDETRNIVGVIIAVNGDVKSMDVFESTPLFRKLWPKLLKSYALDAANEETAAVASKVASRSQAIVFLRDTAKAKPGQVETNGDLSVSHRENEQVLLFSAHQERNQNVGDSDDLSGDSAGLGGMPGGLGGAIHAAGFAK